METVDHRTLEARKRATTYKTKHRGLVYRELADGSRTYLGFVPGKGRVKLEAKSLKDAIAEHGELRGRVAKGHKIPSASIRFEQVAEEWYASKEGRLREWTRIEYRRALDKEVIPVFGHRRLRDITIDDVAKWVKKLQARSLSASTIENYLKPLSGTFKHAVRRELVNQNPVALLTRDERPQRAPGDRKAYEWTSEEIVAVFRASEKLAAKPDGHDANYTPLLRMAVYSGLRLGELLGLQWRDLDFEAGVIEVRRQFTKTGSFEAPKTHAGLRRVPLRPELVVLLKAEKEKAFSKGRAKPEDLVFPNRYGKPKLHRVVQRAWNRIRDEAKLPERVTFHDLRHAFASIAVASGADALFLAQTLGHANPAITFRVYAHLFDREAKEDAFRQAMSSQPW